ncbi:MAG TPA: alpha/beta hydrolase [Steroidobacteraceae bacterium]|jgi:pimeloyl-ACP methyl ester carboxylesterase|nr:alpha/beta hydrolase [Steroidobacteraceae bacterium]
MRSTSFCLLLMVGFVSAGARAQPVPPAIFTDPPADRAHPAAMTVVHIPSHGVLINGLVYAPSGAGPHATLIICHGLPGNEKNLDLAQAVRRAGWNAVTFNYRGSWGSPGAFRFAHNPEDADAVLAYLRDPSNAAKLGVDPKRIAIAGHSMGGWVVAHTASHDHALLGAILISMADMGTVGSRPHAQAVAAMADDMETLSDVTAESMVDELAVHAKEFGVAGTAEGLARIPLLAITANDHLASQTEALARAITAKGGKVTLVHMDTDHSYSDHRIALESSILTWLSGLN